MDLGVLLRIYPFPYKTRHLPQDRAGCAQLASHLTSFSEYMTKNDNILKQPQTGYSTKNFEFAAKFLANQNNVYWLPAYGCAILCHHDERMITDMYSIQVIIDTKSYNINDNPSDFLCLPIGSVSGEDGVRDLLKKFWILKGRDLGLTSHRTPSTIETLLYRAMKCKCEDSARQCDSKCKATKGGFSDIVLKKGRNEQDTCFTLVKSVYDWSLNQNTAENGFPYAPTSLAVTMHFHMFNVRRLNYKGRKLITKHGALTKRNGISNFLFYIIRRAACNASELACYGFDVTPCYNMLHDTMLSIIEYMKKWDRVEMKKNSLLKETHSSIQLVNVTYPSVSIHQPSVTNVNTIRSSVGLRNLIIKNLGDLSKLDAETQLSSAKTWCTDFSPKGSDINTMFFLCNIESLFWKLSDSKLDREALKGSDMNHIHALVKSYRSVLHNFQSKYRTSSNEIATNLRCLEILVVWVSYCLVFNSVSKRYPDIMKGFGVALRYSDLQHLVLQTKTQRDVLERVVYFLYKNHVPDHDIFSLRTHDSWESATYEMGERFSEKMLRTEFLEEEEDAKTRVDLHWGEVQEKQNLASSLRDDLVLLENDLAEAELNERNVRSNNVWEIDDEDGEEHQELNACIKSIKKIKSDRGKKRRQLKKAEEAPDIVIQPLPKDRKKAMKVLFFMYMPTRLKLLELLSFTSQQLLLPASWKTDVGGQKGTIECKQLEKTWSMHYNAYQKINGSDNPIKREATSRHVQLSMESPSSIPPKSIHVDSLRSPDDDVWYPDDCGLRMSWTGGKHRSDKHPSQSQFNPFLIESELTARYLTFKFPKSDEKMQWCVHQKVNTQDIDPSRGNLPYSSQHLRPSWLSKEGYFDLTNLRAFPHLELRQLCHILLKGTLPMDEESVRLLIRQVMYHIGELNIHDDQVVMSWRQDFRLEESKKAYFIVLQYLATKLKDRPHNFEACRLVGELSCFLSPYSSSLPFKDIGRTLAKSAMDWVESYGDEISNASPADMFPLRSKQVIYSYLSILCIVGGDISDEDAAIILQNRVLARNLFVEDDDEANLRKHLKTSVEYLLCSNMSSYHSALSGNKKYLTDATQKIIESCPNHLEWTHDSASICYEAVSTTCHHYNLNPLSGIVLLDGLPPSNLPASITKNPLFKKIFDENRFDVIRKGAGYESVRRVEGCYYRFYQNDGSKLIIQESSRSQSYENCWDDMLELVDFTSVDGWGKNLPARLRIMYSHWLSKKRSILLFRPFTFHKRKPHYIFNINKAQCRKVSTFREIDHWQDLLNELDLMDQIIKHETEFLEILERIEGRDYIHTYSLGEKETTYVLKIYRFGLSFRFELGGKFLFCQEITGYRLADKQHLPGTLYGLRQYLVLNSVDQCVTSKVMTKLIVPDGDIVSDNDGFAKIIGNNDVNHMRKVHVYDLHHRFNHLIAHNISARLHLAGLHVATTSYIPDSALGKTGEERAMELIRECWVNRPLSDEENHRLENVKNLSKGSYPSLYLLCLELKNSSMEFDFLYTKESKSIATSPCTQPTSNDVIAYCHSKSRYESNPRQRLSRLEELRTIKILIPDSMDTRCTHSITALKESEVEPPCSQLDLNNLYATLRGYLEHEHQNCQFSSINNDTLPFPRIADSPLEKETHEELLSSWKLYHEVDLIQPKLSDQFIALAGPYISSMNTKISELLTSTEKYLISVLSGNDLEGYCGHDLSMKRFANIIPRVTKSDLARFACFPELMKDFNPFLCKSSREQILNTIIVWLELCVLQDKIEALNSHLDSGDKKAMLIELQNAREWSTVEHPYWLVFEVEQKIRIRQEQYKVAKHLIGNPGHIVQLNMGLGKTRVILPMLVLHYSFAVNHDKFQIPRLHVPSALLNESFAYFHNTLCASVLNKKIFFLPFDRSVNLTINQANSMKNMLIDYCRRVRGFILVSPESRLSLELKSKELYVTDHLKDESPEVSRILNEIIDSDWKDVFDEVDEILHHRNQMIYAIGNNNALPQGNHRWEACQTLLEIVMNSCIPGVTVIPSENGCFPIILLHSECSEYEFRNVLVHSIIENPPHRYRWINGFKNGSSGNVMNDIKKNLLDPEADPKLFQLTEDHFHDLLALRGFLAYDVLMHCLMKRHRVDYGVKINGNKRLAIPFRGADTPSERSEFSHPDCAIGLTVLAYYKTGLTDDQMKEALLSLLKHGENARRVIYEGWFESVQYGLINVDEAQSIDSIEKIDLSNKMQLRVLCHYYKRNMKTIYFWLSTCVFPSEMSQYSHRLVANSWHLAHNEASRVIGFSGTNDNHRILPLQLSQYLPWQTEDRTWKQLLAANGRMIDIIIKKTKKIEEVSRQQNGSNSEAIQAYMHAIFDSQNSIHALIDSGALLAGCSNSKVAHDLLVELPDDFLGVIFFDNDQKDGWVILERSGRCLPKEQSPINEREAFVIFDEPRCRGSDLKLRSDAVAIQTLGRGMCKDKFMQGAGRMRKLHEDQTLIIVASTEVFYELKSIALIRTESAEESIETRDVLSWVMQNTIKSIWKGLSKWTDQGLFFATSNKPLHSMLAENNDLDSMYGSSVSNSSLGHVANVLEEFHRNRGNSITVDDELDTKDKSDEELDEWNEKCCITDDHFEEEESNLADDKEIMIQNIVNRCRHLGQSYSIMKTGVEEECERELQLEVEEEQVEDVEEVEMIPMNETDWDCASLFQASSISELTACQTLSLPDVVLKHLSMNSLGRLSWSKNVFCTRNFLHTVSKNNLAQRDEGFDQFLRTVDFLVHFPSGEYLLVSEREASFLLQEFGKKRDAGIMPSGHYLSHRSFECNEDLEGLSSLFRIGAVTNDSIDDHVASSLQLFAGETMYGSEGRKLALRAILSDVAQKVKLSDITENKPEELVRLRGKYSSFEMSDLEEVWKTLISEAEADVGGSMSQKSLGSDNKRRRLTY